MKPLAAIAALSLALACASAQDKVTGKNGIVREGKILSIEGDLVRVRLAPINSGQIVATTSIRRADISKIVFGPDVILDEMEKNISGSSIPAARAHWDTLAPLLSLPESAAGRAGCVYGEALLLSAEEPKLQDALAIFRRIEKESWCAADRARAARGRVRAMLALGQTDDASREAEEMAKTAGDASLLIQAKLLLAQARLASLRRLLAENPRWDQDPPARAERARLSNEGLDFALHPFLFYGASRPESAEGLWIAHELYEASGDHDLSAEVCRDIASIYADTQAASRAREFLAASPGSARALPE